MRIGLFVPSFSRNYNKVSASMWIRAYQMVDFYKAEGCSVHINNPFLKYDVAIYYRGVDYKAIKILRFLKKTSKLVMWDTCVNYFENHYTNKQWQIDNAKIISSIVDGIVVTTEKLSEVAKIYNNNVLTLQESINFKQFEKNKKELDFKDIIFGWSGVSHKAFPLNNFKDIISGRTTLITDNNIINHELTFKYKHVRWNYDNFPKDILGIDVCLAPRDFNNRYDLMHSSFKILVFCVCGIPVITNKLPSYVKLAGYYDGIYFLEDYHNDLSFALDALKSDLLINKNLLDTSRLKDEYSCKTSAKRLIKFVRQKLS